VRGRVQASAEHLIDVSKCLYSLFLPDNLVTQRVLEMAGRRTSLSRVQHLRVAPLRCRCHNISFSVVIQKRLDTTSISISGSFPRDPLANVCWAIPDLDAVDFAAVQKPDSLSIHEG